MIMAAVGIGASACGTLRDTGAVLDRPPESGESEVVSESAVVTEIPSENAYYYYTESQIQKRRGNFDAAATLMKQAIDKDPDSLFLHRELAKLYLQKKDNVRALAVVEQILNRAPEDVEALIIYGQIQLTQKNLQAAKAAYEKVIGIDPNRERIYLILGGIYREEQDLERALDIYTQLVEHYPQSYAGHYYIGKILFAKGNTEAAERELKKTIELAPDLEEPRFELIRIYESRGNQKESIRLYREILGNDPDNIRAGMALAVLHYRGGRTDEGDALLSSIGRRSMSDRRILSAIVKVYLDPGDYEGAVMILDGMAKGAPDNPGIHFLSGVAYDGLDQSEEAIAAFLKVPADSKFYENAVVHIAFLYQKLERVDDGIEFLQGVIRTVPDNPEFHLHLGTFYESVENYARAEDILRKGLSLDPENPRLHFRMGVVYDKWGRKEDSIQAMKTVIRLDPKHANALNYLGYTYADLGKNLDEAERLIKEALKHKPDDGYITDSLGWVYYKKGRYEEALKYLERAASIVPDDPIILEHVGDVHLKLSNKEKALEFYRRSLEIREKDREAVEEKIKGITNGRN